MKIKTIRLHWDQGSLLKLVDVIGARARNWPIRDGTDQARLIKTCAAAHPQGNDPSRADTRNGDQNEVIITSRLANSKNVAGDPHASFSLFAPQETPRASIHQGATVAPRASAKPPPRDYHDLFAGNDSDDSPAAQAKVSSPQKENRGQKGQASKPAPRDYHDLFVGNDSDASPAATQQLSPQKDRRSMIAPKGGSGKNFQPSRLFEDDSTQPGAPGTPGEYYKVNTKRYNHFELGEGNQDAGGDGQKLPNRSKTKHQSQWDFEDFMTPEKVPQKIRDQDVRHFGWSDDEPMMDSPMKHPAVHQPRPDARNNFEFEDDGTPAADRRLVGHPRGQANSRGIGLYKNDLFEQSDRSASPEKHGQPLSAVTNLKNRNKNFATHFSMADESPRDSDSNGYPKHVPESRAKAIKMMGTQWDATDESPKLPSETKNVRQGDQHQAASKDKENYDAAAGNRHIGIKSGGDGMGGKKGSGRNWGFGDDSDEDGVGGLNAGKFKAGKKQQAPTEHTLWDF